MIRILQGDCREVLPTLPAESMHACITSPPYFRLRSYLPDDHPDKPKEIGLETTIHDYINTMVTVFREVARVLRRDGVLVLNLGDSYATGTSAPRNPTSTQGLAVPASWSNRSQKERVGTPDGYQTKDLLMMPFRVAMALQEDGWLLRSVMPWVKRSCMPESVTDRPVNALEYVFLLTRQPAYFWDCHAVKRQGAIEAGTRAAKGGNVRSALKDVNGRPPEYWEYTGERHFRNTDLFFDSLDAPFGLISAADGAPLALDVNTSPYRGSHFATFPPNLVDPLLKAATSEHGCCKICGTPWRRVVEKRLIRGPKAVRSPVIDARDRSADKNDQGANRQRAGHINGLISADLTKGWEQICACPAAEPIACTVLDPFGGAGTVGLVADRLHRDAVLIELNDEFASMTEARLRADIGMFGDIRMGATP